MRIIGHQIHSGILATIFVVIISLLPVSAIAAPAAIANPYARALADGLLNSPPSSTGQPSSPPSNQPASPGTIGVTPGMAPPGQPQPIPTDKVAPVKTPTYVSGAPTQVIRLKYMRAEQAKMVLSLVVPEERMRVETMNNCLAISASEDEFNNVIKLLAQIDMAPRQVMFEVEAVEINRVDSKNIGIDWGAITAVPDVPKTDGSAFVIPLPLITGPAYSINLAAKINRLVDERKGRVLVRPRVAAMDGQTAQILIGDRLAVENRTIIGGSEVISVTYIDVGIKLEITPFINDDGYITTRIKPEVSNKTDVTANGNPNIRTRQADTTLRVKDGQTIILGGLYQREEIKNELRVPYLGDLPWIGALFRTKLREKRDTELVILLTPRIMVDN